MDGPDLWLRQPERPVDEVVVAGHRAEASIIRIAITAEAFEAIARTLALGTVAFETEFNEHGTRFVWAEVSIADRLGALRRRGESVSDVILRLAAGEGRGAARG